jgi:hypothetical protein
MDVALGSYGDKEVIALPLSGKTVTQSFDELALLLPALLLHHKPIGNVAGPESARASDLRVNFPPTV